MPGKSRAGLLDRVQPYTKSTGDRLYSMYSALEMIDKDDVPGDVVECGVWRGGNMMLARIMSPMRTCWLYDTFDGMTEPHPEHDRKRPHEDGTPGEKAIDRYNAKKRGGTKWDAVSLEEVQAGFDEVGLKTDRVHFIAGPVEKSLDMVVPIRIALLRLDVDWWQPTKICMEKLYPLVVPGGFLIVDDYGHWMGAKKAVDDYFNGRKPPHTDADYSCRIFRKP